MLTAAIVMQEVEVETHRAVMRGNSDSRTTNDAASLAALEGMIRG